MKIIEKLDNYGCREINRIILGGGIVLWPSGGVYGLACDCYNKIAVERMYEIKKRDIGKPFSIIVNYRTADKFGYLTMKCRKIIYSLWPDFIGVIVKKKKCVPDFVTAGYQTVGLVCSSSINVTLADEILIPLASTSANISGKKEISVFYEAFSKFDGIADAIIAYNDNNNQLNTLAYFDEKDNVKIIRIGKYSENEVMNFLDKI